MLNEIKRYFNKPSYIDFFALFCQLKALLESGITIIEAVSEAANAQNNKLLKDALLQICRELRVGVSTSTAFKNVKIFPNELPAIVAAGERSGELVKTFENLANTMWMKATLYSKVNNALLTPKIAGSIGFIIFTVFTKIIMPKYQKMYAESGIEMPQVVKVYMTLANGLFDYWYITLLVIFGVYRFWKWFSSAKRDKLDTWKLHLWVYKELHRRLIQHEFASNLSLMHDAGIVPAEACEMISKIVSNSVMRSNIRAAGKAIVGGTPIAIAFRKHNREDTFGPIMLSFLEIGTRTGMLAKQMDQAAKIFELEINSQVNTIGNKLTIIVLTPMAFLIAGMYLMSLIPMLGYFNKIANM